MPTENSQGPSARHRQYVAHSAQWSMMRDVIEGEEKVKQSGATYLPVPPALQTGAGGGGQDPLGTKYQWYKDFAELPSITEIALFGVQGILHHQPPDIKLPSRLKYLMDTATPDGKDLHELWEDVTRDVFQMGRIGLMPTVFDGKPRLAQYSAESIINWRAARRESAASAEFVVLREIMEETGAEDLFTTNQINFYRVLRLNERGQYTEELWRENTPASLTGSQPLVGMVEGFPLVPTVQGTPWKKIPFVMVNSLDLEYDVGPIPLLPVARKALRIYRKSATYHRAIYTKCDPPMVRTGVSQEEAEACNVIGGLQIWNFANPDASAVYVEPSGNAIPYQREAILDDFDEARQAVGKLIDNPKGGVESGDALRERRAAQSVSLLSVVVNAAKGLERALQQCAIGLGADPKEVEFKPNTDFVEGKLEPGDLKEFMVAMEMGLPMAMRSVHENLRRGGATRLTWEEEEALRSSDPELPRVAQQRAAMETGINTEGEEGSPNNSDDNPNNSR